MNNLVIIGAGQLGSRHLQGLAKAKCDKRIYVYDPNPKSLEIAQSRYSEVCDEKNLILCNSYQDLPKNIKIAIIATTADSRRKATEELCQNSEIEFMILEKILFQKNEDFEQVSNLVKDKGIKVYVNCARRIWNFYREIKEKIKGKIFVSNCGAKWGIGTSALHYIDLVNYLTDALPETISTENLDKEIVPSKRSGFVEFSGQVNISFSDNSILDLYSFAEGDIPDLLQISDSSQRWIIDEMNSTLLYAEKKDGWELKKTKISIPYQSELSGFYIDELINKGKIELTDYETSTLLHLPLLDALRRHMGLKGDEACPIT